MLREVDLMRYLPAFLLEYEELRAALSAMNPDFRLVWQTGDETLNNCFVLSADTNAIGRYEKIYGIQPDSLDAVEQRRARVMGFLTAPYPMTLKYLNAWLKSLYEKNGACTDDYDLHITFFPVESSITDREFEAFIVKACPLNMNIELTTACNTDGGLRAGAIAESDMRVDIWPNGIEGG